MSKSFGQLIGGLILRKRKALGLTQLQLSEDAFGTPARVRRISELENGTVSNPHPRTIDPLLVALGVSEPEIAKCAEEANYHPDDNLTEAYSHIESTLRKVAEQFENENPRANFDEITQFLESKAREYANLKQQMNEILESSEGVSNSIQSASSQIEVGNIEGAMGFLKIAEDTQLQEKTIKQIRKQASISITRGNCAFLQDDLALCYQCYERAALYLSHFDKLEMITLFEELAGQIYEGSRRSAYPHVWISVDLLNRCFVEIENTEICDAVLAGLHLKTSMALRQHSIDLNAEERFRAVESSIDHAREAVKLFGQFEDDSEYDLPSAQVVLANSFVDLSRLTLDHSHIDTAIEILSDAYDRLEQARNSRPIFSYVANSLGAAMLRKSNMHQEHLSPELMKRTREVFSASEICARENFDIEALISASINLGQIFFSQSQASEENSQNAEFLRLLAISKFTQCQEFFSKTRLPYQLAELHFLLGEVLYVHALHSNEEMYEFFSMRCLDAYFQSLEFITVEDEPERYAYIKCQIGGVYGNHAVRIKGETEKYDLEKAIESFEEAEAIYSEKTDKSRLEICRSNLDRLKEELHKID
ncbi:helix-turn-helix domain-containing protein [Thalassospira lucentensis]|uniref:helix-turn-helix domain-containing protein n=1 Tax=Thalassospira lucentensis TaxID=168935 RepID=UPI0003FACB91|nr:helix-turn-helix transcriptional regulator [Thalassospira lucentensis]